MSTSRTLYRAVPAADFDPSRVYSRALTPRLPVNIPYVVDNLWEAIRPNDMPSRRHSAYASPTPELAAANASAAGHDPSLYVVCEVELDGPVRLAQIPFKDAREHPDIRIVQKAALAALGQDFAEQTLAQRSQVAALFLPGLSPEHLNELARENMLVEWALERTQLESTFWSSATTQPSTSSDGELFFELLEGSTYKLAPYAAAAQLKPARRRP